MKARCASEAAASFVTVATDAASADVAIAAAAVAAIISLTGNQPSTVYCVSQSFKTRFCFYTVRLCLFSFHLTFVVNKHLVKQQPACFGLQIGHRCHLKWVWSVW